MAQKTVQQLIEVAGRDLIADSMRKKLEDPDFRKSLQEADPDEIEAMTKAAAEEVADESVMTLRELAVQLQQPVYTLDRYFYWIVVISLGVVAIGSVVGAIIISTAAAFTGGQTTEVPDMLVASASAAIGALAGLFAAPQGDLGQGSGQQPPTGGE